jgi:hypothetical protein
MKKVLLIAVVVSVILSCFSSCEKKDRVLKVPLPYEPQDPWSYLVYTLGSVDLLNNIPEMSVIETKEQSDSYFRTFIEGIECEDYNSIADIFNRAKEVGFVHHLIVLVSFKSISDFVVVYVEFKQEETVIHFVIIESEIAEEPAEEKSFLCSINIERAKCKSTSFRLIKYYYYE